MPLDVEDNLFLLAGPVKIHPRVQRAMATPAIGHRGPEFTEINRELADRTRSLFDHDGPVAVLSGSGTAGMEAAVAGLVGPDDHVVSVVNGKFGDRMRELADRYAGQVTVVEADWGDVPDLDAIDETLADGGTALTLTHNETSTGVTNPAEAIGDLVDDRDATYIVDGVTSVGGIEVDVDGWGIDACITGSQKCLAGPAGLAFVAVAEDAVDDLRDDVPYYTDLARNVERWEGHQTPFTPAIPLHQACLEALRILDEETLQGRIDRTRRCAEMTRAGVRALGLELFAREGHRSDTVTAVRYPDGVDDEGFRGTLREMGAVVAGGQRHLSGKIFRVGHMGLIQPREILEGLGLIEATLDRLGADVKPGAAVAAAEDHL